MKQFIIILCGIFLFIQPARAQFGLMFGEELEIVKIGASAREVLRDYLAEDYWQQCGRKGKKKPDICQSAKPYYTSSALPSKASYNALPQAVLDKIGFIHPGAVYVQNGFTVYLVRWPNKIIYDHVSYWD